MGSHVKVGPSTPEMPAAAPPPAFSKPTSFLFTKPLRVISTTFMAAGPVTRRPSLKTGSSFSQARWRLMSLPPPCTSTSGDPARRKPARAAHRPARADSSSIIEPPILITTGREGAEGVT